MRPVKRPPEWVLGACGDIYRASLTSPPDKVLAEALRSDPRLDAAFVADTVQGMLRARGLVEAGLRHGARDPVFFFLCARRGWDGVPGAIAKAERDTGGVDALVPLWLATALGPDMLRAMSEEPPTTLRANVLNATRRDVAGWLEREDIETRPTEFSPWGLTLVHRANVFRTETFREGFFEMQDEASQLVALLCDPRPGDTVVDACAGAGGKTLALAACMENRGTLYAFDTAAFRLEELRRRAKRAGVHNLRVHALAKGDARPLAKLNGKADVVLVDAPCSGTGVLRRNPDIGWRLREEDVKRLVAEQAALLGAYAPLVKPGGRLVYAVCSLLPAEGEAQVAGFLRGRKAFRRADAAAMLPKGVARRGALQVDPLHHGCDGFYAAALERENPRG